MPDPDSSRWLLVTDVDDTLCGDPAALERFADQRGDLLLVLNSSRPRTSVLHTVADFPPNLPVDGLITALGTEIHVGGEEMETWTARFEEWDRRPIDELMASAGIPAHPDEMQTPYKASFAVPKDRSDALAAEVMRLVPGTRIVISGQSDFDAIPAAAGKGAATRFVAELLGVPRERLVVAGDSGNDLDLFAAATMAIAVGNARPELTELANPNTSYFARATRADGLLEGLRHWGALSPESKSHAQQNTNQR